MSRDIKISTDVDLTDLASSIAGAAGIGVDDIVEFIAELDFHYGEWELTAAIWKWANDARKDAKGLGIDFKGMTE